MARLAELGRDGLLLLCGDSTNADRPGVSDSESIVGPHLERVFHHCKGRIVVTCFASNIHRVQQVVDAAAANGRKVALRRPLDAQERQHRPLAGPHRRARGHARPAARDRPVPRREARDHLDRLPGRAAERAAADGLPRPPAGRAQARRHRRLLRHADPGQRARGQRDDRPAVPHRLRRRDGPRRADPRLRPRLPGGAQDDAQPHAAAATSCRSTATSSGCCCTAQLAEAVGVPAENIFRVENGTAAGDRRRRRPARRARDRRGWCSSTASTSATWPTSRCATAACSPADGIFIIVATISEQDGSSVVAPEVLARGVPFLDDERPDHRGAARRRRGLARPRRRAARDARSTCSSRCSTTTSRRSSTTGSSAARWCCRSSSRSSRSRARSASPAACARGRRARRRGRGGASPASRPRDLAAGLDVDLIAVAQRVADIGAQVDGERRQPVADPRAEQLRTAPHAPAPRLARHLPPERRNEERARLAPVALRGRAQIARHHLPDVIAVSAGAHAATAAPRNEHGGNAGGKDARRHGARR